MAKHFLVKQKQIVIDALIQEPSEDNNDSFYLKLEECLLNLPPLEVVMDNPITINNIVNHQSTYLTLLNIIITEPHN